MLVIENKEYLNEESYQKTKKKIVTISIIILIIGLLIGGSLIYKGIIVKKGLDKDTVAQKEEEKKKEVEAQQKEQQKDLRINELNELIENTQKQIDNIEIQITKLKNEQTSIFEQDSGFSDRYNAKEIEIKEKQNEKQSLSIKLSEYKVELSSLKSTSYLKEFNNMFSNNTTTNNSQKYIKYFMLGGFVIFTCCIISGFVYMIAKRREILAFTAQQTIPVAKEGIEKMSESVSKVGGDMAREISKGIEEGKAQARVPHVVKCPHCGADNEIIGKTGTCEFCQSKISFKN